MKTRFSLKHFVNDCGLRPSDPSIYQLIAITHGVLTVSYANPSLVVRGVFLDLSKAFDRVWQEEIFYKLKLNGIDD